MNSSKYSIFIFLICFCFTNTKVQAQSLNQGTIGEQFDFVISKSNNFSERGQNYEVINLQTLLELKAHALDSIKTMHTKLENAKSEVSPLQQQITTLKTNLSESQNALALIKEQKDDMNLLGMQMSKASYSLLMWSVIAVLFALLLFFIYRFKNSNAVTITTKESLENLENEFKEHRAFALEREQKVMRQLQDERNKHKGM